MSQPPLLGSCYEETVVGRTWRSPGRTITETDVTLFAMLSGDWYPLHVDKEYAARSWAGERIAHGVLTLAIMSGAIPIAEADLQAFLSIDHCQFRQPVRIGDSIRSEFEVVDCTLRAGSGAGRVEVSASVFNQHNELVMDARLSAAQRCGRRERDDFDARRAGNRGRRR
jgi:acyl dehydratase